MLFQSIHVDSINGGSCVNWEIYLIVLFNFYLVLPGEANVNVHALHNGGGISVARYNILWCASLDTLE